MVANDFASRLPLIGHTTTLGWDGDDFAREYMEYLVQRARTILGRHGWRVGCIKEFYPRGKRLLGLNVNRGSEVCIRFRSPEDRQAFLPFPEVVCTMLHELAHCAISRHDRSFWDLHKKLVEECEALEVELVGRGAAIYPRNAQGAGLRIVSVYQGHTANNNKKKRTSSTSTRRKAPATSIKQQQPRGKQTVLLNDALPSPSSSSAPLEPRTGFIGAGNRLGGLPTPPASALRDVLLAALRRRMDIKDPANDCGDDEDDGRVVDGDVDDEEVMHPDLAPDEEPTDGGGWACERCHFHNRSSSHVCEYCSDWVVVVDPSPEKSAGNAATERVKVVKEDGTGHTANTAVCIESSSEEDEVV